VLNGDGVVRVRFVDTEEEGEKKAGGSKHSTLRSFRLDRQK